LRSSSEKGFVAASFFELTLTLMKYGFFTLLEELGPL
jgi:hypothetical protein